MRRFIQGLISRNIELGIADSKLRVKAPKGTLTEAEQQTLKDNRQVITDIIQSGFGTTGFIASEEQARLWGINKVHTGPCIFNIAIAARVSEAIDKYQLDRAIKSLCQSVPVLRSSFREVDTDVIIESNTGLTIAGELIECKQGDADHKGAITAFIQRPFNISAGPLFRIGLINEEQSAVLVVVMHHLIGDMASLHLVLDRINKIYHNAGGEWAEPLHVPSYVSSENSMLYWRETLRQIKPFTQWYQQPVASIGFQGDCHYQQVPAAVTERVFNRCKGLAVTPTVLLLTVLQKVLQYATGEKDFAIGIPVDTRFDSNKRNVIGFYSKPLPLREQVSDSDTFGESVSAVHKSLVEAVANRQITTRDIGRIIGSARKRDRNIPAFQVLFNYLDNVAFQSKGDNKTPDFLEINRGMTDMDLFVNCIFDNNRLIVSIEYRSQLFSGEDISLLSNGFIELLDLMTAEDVQQWSQPVILEHTPLAKNGEAADSTISIVSTFTCEPIVNKMRLWTDKLGYNIEYAEDSYGQIIQSLLRADSAISAKGNLAKVILIRPIDWIRYLNKEEDPIQKIDANSKEFADCLLAATSTSAGQFFVGFCPHDETSQACTEAVNFHISAVEHRMIQALSERPSIHCISSAQWSRYYPCEVEFDALQDKLGHIPFSEDFILAIATLLVRRILRANQPLVKVLVVDCDNTLWKGIIGDDGVDNIGLTDGYRAVQDKVTEVAGSGVLICLCSKNNEQNISEYFRVRYDSIIRLEHITAQRINWESKSSNIRSLAKELNLGLDSFVFLDDSSIECAEVRANCPEVLTIQLPSDEASLKHFIENLWVLDIHKVTITDRNRVDLYRDNAARKKHEDSFADYNSFLESLDLKISFTALSEENISRAAQMTQRTNQFNATTIRRSEAELNALAKDGANVWLVDVSDRFGDYGQVGELIIRTTKNALVVDTFLLSCRVLGRGVEHQMVRFIGKAALESGLEKVLFNYRRTFKNDPILSFFNKLGAEVVMLGNDECIYELSAVAASMLVSSIGRNSSENIADTNSKAGGTTRHDWSMTETIALLGADLERINSFLSPHSDARGVQHNNEVVEVLTSLWEGILQHTDFTLTDDFFSVGGDSLGLVQLLSAVKRKFDIELPIDNFVVSCTIAGMHDIIENGHDAATVKIADPNEDVYLDLPDIAELERFTGPAYWNILLTGATGFLGAFILKDLVLHSQARYGVMFVHAVKTRGSAA
jgi:FkbH-like protein